MFNLIILAIEDEYEGPCLEDGKVTLKFVTDLMEYYKEQKKLHKKYAYKVSVASCIYILNIPFSCLLITCYVYTYYKYILKLI